MASAIAIARVIQASVSVYHDAIAYSDRRSALVARLQRRQQRVTIDDYAGEAISVILRREAQHVERCDVKRKIAGEESIVLRVRVVDNVLN